MMSSLHLVLVEPEIHWNTGNVARTALAVGAVLHLVDPLGFSLEDRQLRRAGLDYWPRVQVRRWPDWEHLERELPRLGTAFCFSSGASVAHWEPRYPPETVLIFGRESVGLPRSILDRHPERTLRIPLVDRSVRSLNLSTAVAVAAYEVLRQRSLG